MSRSVYDNAVSQFRSMNNQFDRVHPVSIMWPLFLVALAVSYIVLSGLFFATGDNIPSAAIKSAALILGMGGFTLSIWSAVDGSRISEELVLCRNILAIGDQRLALTKARLRAASEKGQSAVVRTRESELQGIEETLEEVGKRIKVLENAKTFVGRTIRYGAIVTFIGVFTTPFSGFL